MTLQLRRFEMRVTTPGGPFGVRIPFTSGLVVLRADNTSGKSTCLQGILYALGLEGMLSASHDIPLPHVATDSLTDETTNNVLPVLESYVSLEFANGDGEIATVRRYAKHASISTSLISVWRGAVLSDPTAQVVEQPFFVRREGAVQRQAGFHHWLSEFLGWHLPEVVRYDGRMSPLYLETIFPLFFVEQKRGWSGIQAQTPTYFRIRDIAQRNVEFVLDLSGSEMAMQRLQVAERIIELRRRWKDLADTFVASVNDAGVAVRGVPGEPVMAWPPEPAPTLWLPSEQDWIPVSVEVDRLTSELEELTSKVLPTAEASAPSVSRELQRHLTEMREVSAIAEALQRDIELERDQLASLDSRLRALREDIRRSKDAKVLSDMGASAAVVSPENCPTCHQELPSTLLDPAAAIVAMPIDKNIQLLQEQIDLFEAMRADLQVSVDAKMQQFAVIDERARVIQQAVRAERETLVAAKGGPSLEVVEQRVRVRDRRGELARIEHRLTQLVQALAALAAEWQGLLAEQSRLQELTTPEQDEAKLAEFETKFKSQLADYGFTSVPAAELSISRDSYLPEYGGFDLGFDLSASDLIRTIWSHRMGLLEVAREVPSHHAGLLVFDEPRQQAADPVSFEALFRRASEAGASGQQVVFATSEPDQAVREMLDGVPHTYVPFSGKMIKRVNES